MNLKIQIRLALLLMFTVIFLGLDYFLPGKTSSIEELDLIYTTTVKTSSGRKPSYDKRDIVGLKNGETYRIGKYPEREYQSGQKIVIVRTLLFGKIKELRILKTEWINEPVSLLSVPLILAFLILAFFISLLNILLYRRYLQIGLVASTLATFLLLFIYLGYF